MFEKNNPTIALNALHIKEMETYHTLNVLHIKEIEICPTYISKIHSDCEKQIILLMIPNEEKES